MVNKEVSIVIRAVDKATSELKNVTGELTGFAERNQATFTKMAAIGGAAFVGITAAAGVSVKSAADAQVAWAAMDTTFGHVADEARDMVERIRKDLPTASREIAKKTTVLGGMAIGMGMSQEAALQLTEQVLKATAAQSAFRGEDPSDTLQSMMAMLSGSTQAARRYGININQAAVEQKALEMGLVSSADELKNMDENMKMQILTQARMQAITDGSVAAFKSLEKEKETLSFKMRELSANTQELREKVGNALIPIVIQLVEKVTPLLNNLIDWIENNQQLTKYIILVSGAIAGLVAGIGTFGLVLPGIITGIKAVGAALLFLKTSPIALLIAAIVGLTALIVKNWDQIKATWKNAVDWIDKVTGGFITALKTMISAFVKFLVDNWKGNWETVKTITSTVASGIRSIIEGFLNIIKGFWEKNGESIKLIVKTTFDVITKTIQTAFTVLEGAFKVFFGAIDVILKVFSGDWKGAWEGIKNIGITIVETIHKTLLNIFGDSYIKLLEGLMNFGQKVKAGWENIRNVIKGILEGIKQVVDFIIGAITGRIKSDIEAWGKIIDWVGGKFKGLGGEVFEFFMGRVNKVLDSVKNAWNGVKSLLSGAGNAVSNVASKVGSALGISGKKQFGGTMLAGRSYLVGERGPEIVTPASTGMVNPIGGGSVNININMGGVVVKSEADEKRLAQKIGNELARQAQLYQLGIN